MPTFHIDKPEPYTFRLGMALLPLHNPNNDLLSKALVSSDHLKGMEDPPQIQPISLQYYPLDTAAQRCFYYQRFWPLTVKITTRYLMSFNTETEIVCNNWMVTYNSLQTDCSLHAQFPQLRMHSTIH